MAKYEGKYFILSSKAERASLLNDTLSGIFSIKLI
jgi:uncharacterized protein (DUF608 family)